MSVAGWVEVRPALAWALDRLRPVTGGWPYPTSRPSSETPPAADIIDWDGKPAEQVATLQREMATGMGFQLRELDGFDQKVSLLLTTIGVLLGLGLAGSSHLGASAAAHACFYVGLLALLLGLLAGIFAYRPRKVEVVPTPAGIFPAFADASSSLLLGVEVEAMNLAFHANMEVRGIKLAYLQLTLRLLMVGAVLLAIGYGSGV